MSVGVRRGEMIYGNVACMDALAEGDGTVNVARPDAGAEPGVGVVYADNEVVFVGPFQEGNNGSYTMIFIM